MSDHYGSSSSGSHTGHVPHHGHPPHGGHHHHGGHQHHGLMRIEAERVIAIVEDTTEKLSFLDSITPDLLQHRDELSKFIGDEISRTMAEQRSLEKRYEELIEQRATMKGMVNKNKYKEVQEEIQDVSRALRESTNNLVRSLKENPNVSGNLIKVQRDRTELHDLLLRCVQELRDRGTYQTVTSKVDEEINARLRLVHLKHKEKELREAVAVLQEKLNEEQKSFSHTTSQQKQAIALLKEELIAIKGTTSSDSRFKKKESLASVAAVYREFKLKERVLEVRLKELEDKLQTENVVHHETNEFYGRKNVALADDVARWEGKYESEVGAMDEAIRDLTGRRKKLLERLSVLQNRRQVEVAAETAAREAKEAEAEKERQGRALLKRHNRASRVIVRELRAFIKYKKDMEALKGGKKGGKGAAKGGKGKKK